MRLNSLVAKALLSSAFVLSAARADEIDDLGAEPAASSVESSSTSTKSVIDRPTFTVSNIGSAVNTTP
jgi:hypothetical protein